MSIRKMKIQQGYIVYQIPAEEIVKLREADCFGNLCDSCNQTIEDTDFEELNINWIEKWCDRLKKENGVVQRW